MGPAMNLTDGQDRLCPVSGLPVRTRPEWTDRRFSSRFRFTTQVIGDRVLLNRPSGHATLSDVNASLELADTIVDQYIDTTGGYVHISDYAGMQGITHDARRRYVRYIETNPNILGVIYFGVSPLFRVMIKLASRLSRVKPNVRIVHDYREALTAAMALLDGGAETCPAGTRRSVRITEHHENGRQILRCDRWRLALDDYRLAVEVVDGRIYHATSMGVMRERHVEAVDRLRESVRAMLGLEKGFPVIMTGTTSGQNGDGHVRRRYMACLKRWHERFPVSLYVFYDANWFVRTAATLAIPFMPFKVRVARDFADALALADRIAKGIPAVHTSATMAAAEDPSHVVHQLLQYIGDIDWEQPNQSAPNPVDPSHPFHPVFDAIALVKSEMDDELATHRRTEADYRTSRQRFEEVLRHSRDILFKRDIGTGGYEYVSDAVETLLGYTPEEFCGMGYSGYQSLVHPEDLPGFLAFNAQMMQHNPSASNPHECLYRVRDQAGNYRWFSDKRSLIRDADGYPTFVIGSNRDVTDQKHDEEQQAQFYERFTTVLDSIAVHIYVADIETYEILFMNRAMRSFYGNYQKGQRCYELFRGIESVCPDCANDKLLDENGLPAGIQSWESRHPVDGRWYLNHDQAIHWVDGRIARLRIAMDISRIKSLENERQQIADRLRHTRKLEAISTLAGGVAHNFNNLLMVVLGNLELLRMDLADGPAMIRKIEAAERSAAKAADLSSLMLTYVGQTRLSLETVDLNTTLDKMVDVIRTTVGEKARLNIKPPDRTAWIKVDESKVYQVITNLVTNAVEAAGDAPLEINLSVGTQYCDAVQLARLAPGDDLAEGKYVWLRVADNGRGMDQETLEKVFDPFFTTKFTGRGLGMAAVMGIMRAHRGGVRIDSRTDAGTSVTVYFPEHQHVVPESKSAAPAATPQPYRGTALLVDDEPLVLELGTQMLIIMGFDVLTATDGVDALTVFEENQDRIVLSLMDINMPRMGGREAIDRLRALGGTFPILVTSGFTEAQARERIGTAQVDGYINKPFRLDQLKAKVDAIFSSDDHEDKAAGD